MLKLSDKIYQASDNVRNIIEEYYPNTAKAFLAYPKKLGVKRDESENTGSTFVKKNRPARAGGEAYPVGWRCVKERVR